MILVYTKVWGTNELVTYKNCCLLFILIYILILIPVMAAITCFVWQLSSITWPLPSQFPCNSMKNRGYISTAIFLIRFPDLEFAAPIVSFKCADNQHIFQTLLKGVFSGTSLRIYTFEKIAHCKSTPMPISQAFGFLSLYYPKVFLACWIS